MKLLTRLLAGGSKPGKVLDDGGLARLPEPLRPLVLAAGMAPSSHNSQPWKFRGEGNVLQILPDVSRRLPVVDPFDRELWISLGCAVENAVIAAREQGWAVRVSHPSDLRNEVTLTLCLFTRAEKDPLHPWMAKRQTNRQVYGQAPLEEGVMAILKAHASTQPASVRVITDASKKRRLGDYVREGIKVQMADAAFVDELACWFRFSAQEAEATRDGLWMRAMGRPEGEREASLASFRVFGKDAVTRFEEAAVSLAPACAVLLSEENKAGWVEAGRLYQRLALELARHEVSFAFHNQPIEVPVLRGQFETEFQLAPHSSQLLLRVGKAPRLPASFRRKTGEVVL